MRVYYMSVLPLVTLMLDRVDYGLFAGGLPMGARRHGHEGALALLWNVVKCLCALVVTAKHSVDELFMQYFYNLSLAFGGFNPRPHRGSIPGPHWVTFVSRPLIFPPLETILWAPMGNRLIKMAVPLYIDALPLVVLPPQPAYLRLKLFQNTSNLLTNFGLLNIGAAGFSQVTLPSSLVKAGTHYACVPGCDQ